ncbi:Hsp20/alpha crystallin family protein [Halosegnis sp.]|uniref:Hsp20/alpha crystallin family protein n=1 Tax=Halosegnis sp. TaxID=2864959 RepID=UPI0035D437E8
MSDIREFGESVGKRLLEGAGKVSARVQEERPLAADLLESDDAYLAVFDAPGVEMDDVQVRFEEGAVHVRLDRFRGLHEEFEMVFPGRGLTLEGSVDLPEGAAVDPEAAEATLTETGTLHVEIPKVRAGTGDQDTTDHDAQTHETDDAPAEPGETDDAE